MSPNEIRVLSQQINAVEASIRDHTDKEQVWRADIETALKAHLEAHEELRKLAKTGALKMLWGLLAAAGAWTWTVLREHWR